ncbi:hypothetical protein OIU78_013766 [Salix suchowensis]|nr:hypothetical protein OIU78_013766 [Salix suchowensis]
MNSGRSLGIGPARNVSGFDSEGITMHQSRATKIGSGISDIHTMKNSSCPVSPIGSPHLYSRSPQNLSGRMSPSPISSPHTASGSSTPLTGGCGAIPISSCKAAYNEPKPDLFRGMSQTSCVFRETISSENSNLVNQLGWPELYDGHPVLADRVSQQLLRDHVKLKPFLDLNPNSANLGRTNGI